jgi:methyltransferase
VIWSALLLAGVTAQRLSELAIDKRNTRRLLTRGAIERGANHYPFLVGFHAAWLCGLWWFGWDRAINLAWFWSFVVLQALRAWTMLSLGERWTTRIIVLPGAPLIKRGPYRFLAHPNYMILVAEVAVLPLAFGLATFALIFSVLNAAFLVTRVREETEALKLASSAPTVG